jgi:hypothetical protein
VGSYVNVGKSGTIPLMHRASFVIINLMKGMHLSEVLFALAGAFILISALVIYQTGSFVFWNTAKVLYGIALILVLKYT